MKEYLMKLVEGQTLTRQETHDIMIGITEEKYNDCQIATLLMGMQTRGVTVDELLGFRDGLLETGKRVNLDDYNTLDIVGTGGDGKNTFNISTCSAFVIAACGYKVTKHGNGSATSVSGASNVLQAHGVKFTTDELVNPCSPKNSLHGAANYDILRLYVNAHQAIGDNFGVITSHDGYDEISLTSGFKLVTNYFEKVFTPKDLGLNYLDPEDIYGGNTPEEAWKIFDSVLEGTSTKAQKDVIIANAACGISVMDRNMSIEDSVLMAREALESGKALETFKRYVELNS